MEFLAESVRFVTAYPVSIYLLAISAITFCQFGWDKYKARRGKWRTPEATLLSLCLIGGSIGGGLAIWLFRHKCSKKRFMRVFYGIVALQVVGAAVVLGN